MSAKYPEWAYEHNADDSLTLNYYGNPIVSPEYFEGEHKATVPAAGGLPPWCTCGWTRHSGHELFEHLADMKA